MKRREFLLVSAGAGAAAAATGQAAAQEAPSAASSRDGHPAGTTVLQQQDEENDENGDNDENDENGEAEDEPDVVEIEVGDNGGNWFDPDYVEITPGTTVRWFWTGNLMHNVQPTSQPDGADWEGHPDLKDSGEYEFTFEVLGTYEYTCTPHPDMDGVIEVVEEIDDDPEPLPPGEQPIDPDEIGVPLQKHFIGIATFFAIFLTLVFAFYVLKYGESPHSGYPERK